mmetsp:Transcript_8306/g.24483  ORF Transcript_8306/g.24483 Transcript_8306/m.24483 type:complete len:382 (+) Transcript_8306:505-1650(+)
MRGQELFHHSERAVHVSGVSSSPIDCDEEELTDEDVERRGQAGHAVRDGGALGGARHGTAAGGVDGVQADCSYAALRHFRPVHSVELLDLGAARREHARCALVVDGAISSACGTGAGAVPRRLRDRALIRPPPAWWPHLLLVDEGDGGVAVVCAHARLEQRPVRVGEVLPAAPRTRQQLGEGYLLRVEAHDPGELEEAELRPQHRGVYLLGVHDALHRRQLVQVADGDDRLAPEHHVAALRGAAGDDVVEREVDRREGRGGEHRDLVDDDDVEGRELLEVRRSLRSLEGGAEKHAVLVEFEGRVHGEAADEPCRLAARRRQQHSQALRAPVLRKESDEGGLAGTRLAREEGEQLPVSSALQPLVRVVLLLVERHMGEAWKL